MAFRHDVFRFLFRECNVHCRVLSEFPLSKFSPLYFPPDWYTYIDPQGNAFFCKSIFLAPRLRPTKPTHGSLPSDPENFVVVPGSVLYSEVISVKVVVLPC